ncbi:FMN-binding negative transcriptional regulator [Flavobacterium pallidum]|uniref:FMN-binding negative transcriptional regulator n=1 Tax=Flavobacterium pallidum TaxID=2172098 RepID=A0A2S1SIV2_9FLAO|nr:FMN-binding negative transcriptional regulator [Flavobacterium pallidum]AWI26267.1 FMN-binding negative transcriptional regulator [Flavobacterium pallidum]
MYIPPHYETTDKATIIAFMKQYPFATIITVKDNFQSATHLPFTISEREGDMILTAHFAKANPQWEQLTENEVLVIFAEPHAYISPSHYESDKNVPTWNYIAVHAYGKGRLITENAAAYEVLEAMIAQSEPGYKVQWDSLPADYKDRMVKGIVAFEITVTTLQAKHKLSQNKKLSERENIISAFEKSDDGNEKAIAGFMRNVEKEN